VTSPRAGDALAPDTLIALAYVGGWTTGVLVWLIERENPRVRFHAAQAVLLFGSLTVLWIACWVGSFAALTMSATAFSVMQRLSYVVLVAGAVLWIAALWASWRQRSWRLPLLGRYAERLASWRAADPRSTTGA
jgi:uncharacterized membrane protein